jgi:hypothetical protein
MAPRGQFIISILYVVSYLTFHTNIISYIFGPKITDTKTCCGDLASCGYPTPLDAMKNGPREKLLYIPCIRPADVETGQKSDKPDYLVTVDIDPESQHFCKVLHHYSLFSSRL